MMGNIQGSGESARTRECHSASKEGKKEADLKNKGGCECHSFVVIKVFQERPGMKSLTFSGWQCYVWAWLQGSLQSQEREGDTSKARFTRLKLEVCSGLRWPGHRNARFPPLTVANCWILTLGVSKGQWINRTRDVLLKEDVSYQVMSALCRCCLVASCGPCLKQWCHTLPLKYGKTMCIF